MASSFFLRLLHRAGGAVTFLLFAAIVLVAVVFIFLAVPETKDKEPVHIAAEIPTCGWCPHYDELIDESSAVGETSGDVSRQRTDEDVELRNSGSVKLL